MFQQGDVSAGAGVVCLQGVVEVDAGVGRLRQHGFTDDILTNGRYQQYFCAQST
ncbi:MAG: hypothetical protein M5U34_40390 [Chloroflexi bacterium]|nr:hypothetical protein [Chloroflexota bacterium]